MREQFEQACRLRDELKASALDRDSRLTRSLSRRVNQLYRTCDDWMTRYEVILGVIDSRFTPSLPLLRRALFDDPEPLVRHDCAFGIGEMGTLKDQRLLFKALQDSAPIVRHEAASALMEIGDERAIQALGPLLNDEASEVRETAALARQLIYHRLTGSS